MAVPKTAWRLDVKQAGGGLFHDLAPHQLDLMYHFFGDIQTASGMATNQARAYMADDMVVGTILFKNNIMFSGTWSFAVEKKLEKDECVIIGSEGELRFSVFDHAPVELIKNGKIQAFEFEPLPHVQQPMIQAVTDYFLDKAANPCSANEGAVVMGLLDLFTKK